MTIVRYHPGLKDVAMRMGRAIHAESRFRDYDYSESRILRLLESPSVFLAFAFKESMQEKTPPGPTPIGFFIGAVQQIWFSETKYGFDLGVYILPEYRGGATVVRLVKAFEKFCKEQGCAEITLSSSADISTDLARRLYARLGYQECGFISQKSVT
jgi:ribosomal protein S18 acetylase RimI-like enzyme